MAFRIVGTAIVLFLWTLVDRVLTTGATLMTGEAAGNQFENSDHAYVETVVTFSVAHWAVYAASAAAFFFLAVIWWGPVKRWWLSMGALVLLAFVPMHAKAYYDKTDVAEAYFILPNESAFLIPDVGANRDSQAQFGSEAYLQTNKVPAKRVLIPHAKFSGSGGNWGVWGDYYVPSARLIIVDRTPYNREWVQSNHRGSSPKDESFPCQTNEGINITVGISIGATVLEENAAKYLYRFSVKTPAGDRSKPEVIFTSVYYARPLTEVMDTTIRSEIQALTCKEFMKRTLKESNSQANTIMDAIEKSAKEYASGVGITLEYIGWGDTFSFDKEIQEVINRTYITDQEAAIASKMAPHVGTLQGLAQAEAVRKSMDKWDGKVPSNLSMWLPDFSSLTKLFSGGGK